MPKPDELQPPRTEPEFIIAVDIGVIAVEVRGNRPHSLFACGDDRAVVLLERGVPIWRVTEREIADRRAGTVVTDLGLHARLLIFGMVSLDPLLGEHSVAVVNVDRATECSAAGVVLDRQSVIERACLAGVAERAGKELGLGVMRAPVRIIFELTGCLLNLFKNDVRDLPGEAGDPEACGVDDLDPVDVARRSPLQLVDRAAGLVGDALTIDQHVFRSLAQSAFHVRAVDCEAGNLDEHVVRGFGSEPGEVSRGIDPLVPNGLGLWRRSYRRVRRLRICFADPEKRRGRSQQCGLEAPVDLAHDFTPLFRISVILQ